MSAAESWMADYLKHTARQESPELFHVWTSVGIIAATLGRKVWLNRRAGGVTYYKTYPGCMYVVLVAGAAVVRKTTAILPAEHLLKSIGKPFIQGRSSVEAFLDQFDPQKGGNPQAVLLEGELTNFVSKSSYLDPLVDVFNAMFDGRSEYDFKTRTGGNIHIPEPSLTVISCSTPENLGDRLPLSFQSSGARSRFIFVYAKDTDREESLTDVEDEDVTQEEIQIAQQTTQKLKTSLARINTLAGPMTFEKPARKWFDEFYHELRNQNANQGEGYFSRKHEHMLKVAMCVAAGEMRMSMREEDLKLANKLLYLTEKNFDKTFAFIGTSFTKDRQRIVDFVASKGGTATTNELYSSMYIYFKDSETLRRTLNLLREAGVIKSSFTKNSPSIEVWSLCGTEFKV